MIGIELCSQSDNIDYFEIEKGAIRNFAMAIGDDNPIYHDEKAAIAKGYPSLVAPLTFPVTFNKEEPELFKKLDKNKTLHGEQDYTFNRRLYAGERIKCVERVVDVYEKTGKNGILKFIVNEKKGYDDSDKLIFIERLTVVVRG